MTPDEVTEIKGKIEALGSIFSDFKEANDKRLGDIEKKGHADPLLEEKVTKLSEAVEKAAETKQGLEDRLEKAETAIQRTAKGEPGEGDESKEVATTERKAAFELFMRKGDASAINAIEAREAKALSTTVDPEGGYLVSSEIEEGIIKLVKTTTPMRSIARVSTIGARSLRIRRSAVRQVAGYPNSEPGAKPPHLRWPPWRSCLKRCTRSLPPQLPCSRTPR
jgi:HK97 family phage major capsid protein